MSNTSSVSNAVINRAWSGLVMMVWPSMMSFAPPPVTASRKLPPRLGVPDAPPVDEEPEEELPHAASDPPSTTAPAPTNSSRRESEKESRFSGSSLGVSTMERLLSRSPCERLSFTAIVRQPILERGRRLVNPPVHCVRRRNPARIVTAYTFPVWQEHVHDEHGAFAW